MSILIQEKLHKILWISLTVVIVPWLFLVTWIPPIFLLVPHFIHDFMDEFFHNHIRFAYVLLMSEIVLNLVNAIILYVYKRFESMRFALFVLRAYSIPTYIGLVWGLPFCLFYLLGPKWNENMLSLLLISFPTLNLSGAFYEILLIWELRKRQKISCGMAVFCIITSFVVGLDILVTFLMGKKFRVEDNLYEK